MAADESGGTFPVHGGTCRVVGEPLGGLPTVEEDDIEGAAVTVETDVTERYPDGVVRIEQSPFRHLHGLVWVLLVVSVVAATASALTDWQYVAGGGRAVGWPWLLAIGLLVPALRALELLWRRLRGITSGSAIPIDSITAVDLTTTEVGWYFKTERTVPLFVVTYRDGDATARRRILLSPRYEEADLEDGIDAFEGAGLSVQIDDSARDLLE